MRKLAYGLLIVACNLTNASYAGEEPATDALDAALSWRLPFGHSSAVQPGFAVTVGYRTRDADGFAGQLLELDVTGARALARIAGLPLLDRTFRAEQNDAVAPPAAAGQETPWYTRSWVLWTAGGIAATLALTGGDGEVEYNHNGGTTVRTSQGCDVGGNVDDQEIPCTNTEDTTGDTCVGEACVTCDDSVITVGQDCSGWTGRSMVGAAKPDVERQRWLDAGTGHMGDLLAR